MSQQANPRRVPDNAAMAKANFLRVTPRKLNLVAQLIRSQSAQNALNLLSFSRKRIALAVKKTLQSAIANAETNHQLDIDRLVVSEAYVGYQMKMRRFSARAKGRAAPIEKFFSNLTIVVKEGEAKAAAEAAPEAAKKSSKKSKPAAKKAAAAKDSVKE